MLRHADCRSVYTTERELDSQGLYYKGLFKLNLPSYTQDHSVFAMLGIHNIKRTMQRLKTTLFCLMALLGLLAVLWLGETRHCLQHCCKYSFLACVLLQSFVTTHFSCKHATVAEHLITAGHLPYLQPTSHMHAGVRGLAVHQPAMLQVRQLADANQCQLHTKSLLMPVCPAMDFHKLILNPGHLFDDLNVHASAPAGLPHTLDNTAVADNSSTVVLDTDDLAAQLIQPEAAPAAAATSSEAESSLFSHDEALETDETDEALETAAGTPDEADKASQPKPPVSQAQPGSDREANGTAAEPAEEPEFSPWWQPWPPGAAQGDYYRHVREQLAAVPPGELHFVTGSSGSAPPHRGPSVPSDLVRHCARRSSPCKSWCVHVAMVSQRSLCRF